VAGLSRSIAGSNSVKDLDQENSQDIIVNKAIKKAIELPSREHVRNVVETTLVAWGLIPPVKLRPITIQPTRVLDQKN
jgi:hypothetical protein